MKTQKMKTKRKKNNTEKTDDEEEEEERRWNRRKRAEERKENHFCNKLSTSFSYPQAVCARSKLHFCGLFTRLRQVNSNITSYATCSPQKSNKNKQTNKEKTWINSPWRTTAYVLSLNSADTFPHQGPHIRVRADQP